MHSTETTFLNQMEKTLSPDVVQLTFQICWPAPRAQFLSAVWSAPDARSALWAYLVPQTLLPKGTNSRG